MGVTLLRISFKSILRLLLHRISQLFSVHSFTPGAAKPASDLKLTITKLASDGAVPGVLPATGANSEAPRRTPTPPTRPGRLKAWNTTGRAGKIWRHGGWARVGRTGAERRPCPRVPGASGARGARAPPHRVAGAPFPCKVTEPSLTLY